MCLDNHWHVWIVFTIGRPLCYALLCSFWILNLFQGPLSMCKFVVCALKAQCTAHCSISLVCCSNARQPHAETQKEALSSCSCHGSVLPMGKASKESLQRMDDLLILIVQKDICHLQHWKAASTALSHACPAACRSILPQPEHVNLGSALSWGLGMEKRSWRASMQFNKCNHSNHNAYKLSQCSLVVLQCFGHQFLFHLSLSLLLFSPIEQ